ncbi:ParB N-terminal domain-containing protein [Novosphingobium jiangmenense]|uniref:ParB N-terminal domain-containing protein n=1 Tax=Novosphingobium jiangmenense TaxID=2791981 RepID=A0ABS0HL97_9SPHN|nr:ParB N-terminal domain-containing protein [Novosphingobium jiangmenense]MBF9152795.1 ParB N-terminal domain-containing protein [Novosphingobium jiangmenense]
MTNGAAPFPPIGHAEKVGVELLDFDQNNPRFTPDKRPSDSGDSAVISMLAASADLSELIQSISTSGYINIEPLIVIERSGRLAVLEGNRRLAAIKALRDPSLAREARISTPTLTGDVRSSLEKILVYRVATEDEARDLIGFKHINGPQSWDAFAKARFAARWLDDEHKKRDAGKTYLTLQQIAGRMGDQHMTIHRMVAAKYVLDQAESEGIYDIEDRKKKSFSFSHLYTGLAYEEFTNYLGMARPNRNDDPDRDPVPAAKAAELRNLLIWLYGSKTRDLEPAVRSQNPDLGRLREVLASSAATAILAQRNNLDEAIITATPVDVRFERHLITANAELQHAVTALEGFDAATQPELQKIAESALKRAHIIKMTVDAAVASIKE